MTAIELKPDSICDQTIQTFPSVTQIIEATMPHEKRVMLDRFYAGKGCPSKINEEAKRRGNQLDAWAKAYVKHQDLPEVDPCWFVYRDRLQLTLDEWMGSTHAVCSDLKVFDHHRFYRGSLDFILLTANQLMVIDLKTKNRYNPKLLDDAFIQCTAYKEAYELMTGDCVDAIAVVTVTPKELITSVVSYPEELIYYSEAWAERLNIYYGSEGWSD